MDKIKSWIKSNFFGEVVFLLTLIAILLLIGLRAIPGGYDPNFHMARIHTLANNLKAGHFPNPIGFNYLGGMGYGVGFFYGNFWLYPFAILVAWGFPVYLVYRLLIIILTIGAMLAIYWATYQLTNRKDIAAVIMPFYVLNNYYISMVFGRAAIGEALAYVFIPLIIVETLNLVTGKQVSYVKYGLLMAALLVSHLLSFMMMVGLIILILLLNLRSLIRQPRSLLEIVKAGIVGAGIGAVFLFPLIQQYLFQKFRDTSIDDQGNLLLPSSSLHLFTAINPKSINILQQGYVGPLIIVLFLVATIASLVKIRKISNKSRTILISALIISVVLYGRNIVLFLSSHLKSINVMQEMWRLNLLLIPLYLLLIATWATTLKLKTGKIVGSISIIFLLISFAFTSKVTLKFVYDRYQSLLINYQTNYGISRGEYLPQSFVKAYPNWREMTPEKVVEKEPGVKIKANNYHELVLLVDGKVQSVVVPKIFYFGYQYQIKTKKKVTSFRELKENKEGLGIIKLTPSKTKKRLLLNISKLV
ncbi:hypothetical protein [Lactobacillus sp. PV034]|uniref:hypothetical protein n=1 Tax=Lactobacillus sp. PV034 TaxID=2594495 RepID=UPI00223F5DE9|nr:hypothetical protein [Lactobacillus sp. PV034]QNQ80983.1 hypothetical protein FP432_05155 [Lactobacillus sp. PV034]